MNNLEKGIEILCHRSVCTELLPLFLLCAQLDEAYKTPPITKRQVKLNHRVPPLPHHTSKDTPKKPTDSPAKQDHTHSNTMSSPIIKTPKSPSTTTPEPLSRQNSDSSSQSLQSKPKGGRRGKSEEVKSPPAEEVGRVTLSGPKFSSMSSGDRVRRVKVRSERIIRVRELSARTPHALNVTSTKGYFTSR